MKKSTPEEKPSLLVMTIGHSSRTLDEFTGLHQRNLYPENQHTGAELLHQINACWRAANYLSVA